MDTLCQGSGLFQGKAKEERLCQWKPTLLGLMSSLPCLIKMRRRANPMHHSNLGSAMAPRITSSYKRRRWPLWMRYGIEEACHTFDLSLCMRGEDTELFLGMWVRSASRLGMQWPCLVSTEAAWVCLSPTRHEISLLWTRRGAPVLSSLGYSTGEGKECDSYMWERALCELAPLVSYQWVYVVHSYSW